MSHEVPTLIYTIQEAIKIAHDSIAELVRQPRSGEPQRIGVRRSGTANNVLMYTCKFGTVDVNYAVRIGKDTALKIKPGWLFQKEYAALPTLSVSKKPENLVEEIQQSETNWKEANKQELSPMLYFYGYIRDEAQKDTLRLCTISEAFNMDLDSFMKNYEFDESWGPEISRQIYELFDKMTQSMYMICFDIKPQNTVINFDIDTSGRPGNFSIKLIDWDADWCQNKKALFTRGGTGEVADKIAGDANRLAALHCMVMVMANFFLFFYNNNIFHQYMRGFDELNKREARLFTNGMESLFAERSTHFKEMARHYFFIETDIFNELYKRSLCKNREEYDFRQWLKKIKLRKHGDALLAVGIGVDGVGIDALRALSGLSVEAFASTGLAEAEIAHFLQQAFEDSKPDEALDYADFDIDIGGGKKKRKTRRNTSRKNKKRKTKKKRRKNKKKRRKTKKKTKR